MIHIIKAVREIQTKINKIQGKKYFERDLKKN